MKQRLRAIRVALTVGSVALLALAVLAPAATGGVPGVGAAPLTIVKTVSGPVPAGTTFTVDVQCVPDESGPGEPEGPEPVADGIIVGGGNSATVTFDATGQPTSPDVISFVGPGACTVTETVNGGATSTTYACTGIEGEPPEEPEQESDGGFSAQQVEPPPVCPAAGPQASPMAVNIVMPNQEATVTVANTFTTATPQPAAQIQARPLFTG